ncbi:MAG TPA: tetratricopeptide repeat protein [Bryobacteraceae bacterium]|nr:tetratricopeptide repeat protein [Bryobacteraceae bacterium]
MEVAAAVLAAALLFGQASLAPPAAEQRFEDRDDGRQQAERDLQGGIAFTKRGDFEKAIPLFLAARGRVAEQFALEFNLALCYVGTRQFPQAIRILSETGGGQHTVNVKNLLAQALVGNHQQEAALKALQEAADISPKNEKLYVLVSQACLDEGLYDLGLRVLDVGMRNLPDSARLHFQRGLFHSQLDDAEAADREFELVQKLAPNSDIAYIAAAEQAFRSGQVQDVIHIAREGIRAGCTHYLLLTMLGEALLRAGATPATPVEFHEAQEVLEKAVADRPGYSSAHIGLGRIYLALDRIPDAVTQLELSRRLDPLNRAVYSPLAAAYRRAGQSDKAREALAALAELNRQEAARIGSAEGGHAGYTGGAPPRQETPTH